MGKGLEGGNDDKKIRKFPTAAQRLGTAKGMTREGKPSVERREDPEDERGMEKFAVDTRTSLEEIIAADPDLHITRLDIDESTAIWTRRGRLEGLKVLEDEIEGFVDMGVEAIAENPESIVNALGVLNAYLERTADENEDALDLGKYN